MKQTAKTGLQRPRVVLVTRKTQLEGLVEGQGTRGQASFFLKSRGQSLAPLDEADARFHDGLMQVQQAIPAEQRRVRVERGELDRFLFAPDDIVLVVGQDGLVPNAAKYLSGQLVIGINPDPGRYDGVLCRHPPESAVKLLAWAEAKLSGQAASGEFHVETRALALAERDDGSKILALNEVFVGHRSHQSARYRIAFGSSSERHSSSGLIVATGTGATGWARSIARQMKIEEPLPGPQEGRLAFFVREPFPSVATQTELSFGLFGGDARLEITSEMADGGVIFADGIEHDRLDFTAGRVARIGVAQEQLHLVVPGKSEKGSLGRAKRGLRQRAGNPPALTQDDR